MKTPVNSLKIVFLQTIWTWFLLCAIIPIGLTIITSFLVADPNKIVQYVLTLANYHALFNHAYFRIFVQSVSLAGSCTILCLLIGYPFAYIIARTKSRHKPLLLLLVIIPFWTSSLIRTYAIMAILKAKGILNGLLLFCGIIQQPLPILYSTTAVLIGSVYDLLPFMILPLYANIDKLNPTYLEAARDLGANWLTTFIKVTIPLTVSGIISGSVLVFLPAMTMFYIPVLLGGAKNLLLGNLIEHQFLTANNWPLGTAISVIVNLVMGVFLWLYWYYSKRKNREFLE